MENPDEYALQRMSLLLCMRDCIANSGANNVNPNQNELNNLIALRQQLTTELTQMRHAQPFTAADMNQLTTCTGSLSLVNARIAEIERNIFVQNQIAGRITASYLCHLVGAPLLEVNDVESAVLASQLREIYGWTGTACINVDLDDYLRLEIVNNLNLGGVPHRIFQHAVNGPAFL